MVVDESQHEAKSSEEGQEESEHCDIGDGDVDDISDSDACHSSHGSDGYDVSLEESDGPFISAPEPPSEQGIHKPKVQNSIFVCQIVYVDKHQTTCGGPCCTEWTSKIYPHVEISPSL